MRYGWAGRCLNIDLTERKIYVEEQDQVIMNRFLGGRGMNIYTLMQKQAAGLEYSDARNNLCFGTGPLTGTSVPANGRHNVSSKSPLTGLFGDSNSGGFFAVELKYAGYDQLIISGKSEYPVYITINNDQVRIVDARHLWGKNVWETEEMLRQELKDHDIQIASIGQAGENQVRYAAVMNNLARAAGRTGMGAVMGSKNLKAIVLRGTKGVKIAHPDRLAQLNKQLLKVIYSAPSYDIRSTHGTSMLVDMYNILGVLPTRNGKDSVFEDADQINGQTFSDKYKIKSKACFACPVHCGHFYSIKDGTYSGIMGEGVEFETMCSLGSKLGNKDLAAILKANNLCNQYGIDTISMGGVIAFIAECYENGLLTSKQLDGLDLEWGNADAILKIIEKISLREGVGDFLAEGVERISKSIPGSESFVQTIKGMEVPTQDVRGLKAWALGWAVSSRGADHCRSFPLAETTWLPDQAEKVFGSKEAANRLSSKGKAAMVKWYEEMNAVGDSLELCRIAQLGCNMPFDLVSEILQAVTGVDFDEKQLFDIGERIINLERIFNLREGLTPSDDRLPRRFTEEPIKTGSSAGQVVNLEPMLGEYYQLRQWDRETGWPADSLLKDLGLQAYK